MKGIGIAFLVMGLVFGGTLGAFGAIHDSNGDFSYWGSTSSYVLMTDSWYWVGKDTPYTTGSAMTGPGSGNTLIGEEYYRNDQTFAELWGGNGTALKGNYLTASGVFAGMDYHTNSASSYTLFSPGYRFNVKDGYLALSCDYATDSAASKSYIKGYDFDYKISNDKFRIFGQLYRDQYLDKDYADFSYMFAATKELVLALKLAEYDKVDIYNGGLTWTPAFGIIDAKVGRYEQTNIRDVSCLVMVNKKLYLGAEGVLDPSNYFTNSTDQTAVLLKAKYNLTDKTALKFAYRLQNGSYFDTMMFVGFQTNY